MIKFEHIDIYGWEPAIRGMRNPYDSWDLSDSKFDTLKERKLIVGNNFVDVPYIGAKDMNLMTQLVRTGDCHAKFARYIIITMDVTAPRFWWPEFDTYKVGTVANSCSTMHKIMSKDFTVDDFSFDKAGPLSRFMPVIIQELNDLRHEWMNEPNKDKKKEIWYAVIQVLPQSYNQKRTVQLNYQVLRNIYMWRKDHKLTEWREFCHMVENLPFSANLITDLSKVQA